MLGRELVAASFRTLRDVGLLGADRPALRLPARPRHHSARADLARDRAEALLPSQPRPLVCRSLRLGQREA